MLLQSSGCFLLHSCFPFSDFHLCFRAGLSELFLGEGCLTCSQWGPGVCSVWGTGGSWAPAEVCKSFLCFHALPQVLLPAGHASSGLWWLCEAGDWIQHLQGGGASPQLLHHSLKAGVDNHGDGEILLQSGVRTQWRWCAPSVPCSIPALSHSFTDFLFTWIIEQLQENLPDSFPQPDLKIPPTGCC